jgi:16S rRNA processing protein RimM
MRPGSNPPPTNPAPGSPSPGEPVFLAVGKLRRPHGLRGELLMEVLTDFPERLQPGQQVYVGPQRQPQRIQNLRWHGRRLLIAFAGYTNPESSAELRNQLVLVRADDRPSLPEGEYYHHQLLGLLVITDTGETLGRLVEILSTGANDVYVVQPQAGPEVLLPASPEVLLGIDLERGEIRAHLIPGLLPGETTA